MLHHTPLQELFNLRWYVQHLLLCLCLRFLNCLNMVIEGGRWGCHTEKENYDSQAHFIPTIASLTTYFKLFAHSIGSCRKTKQISYIQLGLESKR